VVLFRYKAGTGPEKVKEIAQHFAGLRRNITGLTGFEYGRNISAERLSDGFDPLLVLTFTDEKSRDNYQTYPRHGPLSVSGGLTWVNRLRWTRRRFLLLPW